ncbi:hypothetical protein [Micromonospora sp. NPDC093277]|uniref:hypothetical protein n=1 Tax=Micromonospora sp. NPDC093277 TaxID=3364291 RepID=UPI00382D450B
MRTPGFCPYASSAVNHADATRRDDEVASGLFTTTRADQLIAKLPAGAWTWLSCGDLLGERSGRAARRAAKTRRTRSRISTG